MFADTAFNLWMDISQQSEITVLVQKMEEDSKDQTSHVWAVPEIEALLKHYREREDDFRDPTTKKKAIWSDICAEMNQHGFNVSPMQCECKMKNMKAMYRKSLEKAERGIDPAARCPFYQDLYEIFGLAPPLRIYPDNAKPRKGITQKRSLGNDGQELGSMDSPTQVQVTQNGLQQNGLSESMSDGLGLASKRQAIALEVTENQSLHETERRNYAELVEELMILRRTLEHERQLRDEERKKNEDERKKYEEERDRRASEFHEERMAMLNSMNKLIGNLGSKN